MTKLLVVLLPIVLALTLVVGLITLPLAIPVSLFGVAVDSQGHPIRQVLGADTSGGSAPIGPAIVLDGVANARPSQFALGLSAADAYAACGPTAAIAWSVILGQPKGVPDVMAIARRGWWDPGVGMHGAAAELGMLRDLNLPAALEPVNWQRVISETSAHRPMILDTPGHYYFADAYDPKSGRLHVGTSGTDLRGGDAWMTPAQINSNPVSQGAVRSDLYLP